ncbi:MAG: thiamine pyrophosphate-requiring protein [Gammaproteobacteria bacterium]
MSKACTPVQSVAAAYLDALVDRGIDYVFANAGTDFAPIIEAMVVASEQDRPIPEFIAVPHENVAISMAHGYYLASGKPSAVMVHVTVGTANALCGLMNASRDNVPVLLAAGHTPNTESGHPGSRNAGIHWGQDSFDQGGLVREYVKWDYELRAGQRVEEIVGRALDIAMSEPRGPVYLNMPREVLGNAAASDVTPPRRQRPLGSQPSAPSQGAINKTAQALAGAEFPLIMTASLGRNPANVELLSRLADEFSIAVGLPGEPGPRDVNIPSSHPMFLGINPTEAIARADVILAIDCEVPWWPSVVSPKADARLIQIAPDPFFANYPLRGFEMDLAIAGSSSAALQMLYAALQSITKRDQQPIRRRRVEIEGMVLKRNGQRDKTLRDAAGMKPINPAWIAACINKVKDRDTIIVNELGVSMDLLELEAPRSYISNSLAGGLGSGLGLSLGARLGAPDKKVILIVGDGSYMFGNPVSAHFIARSQGLPTLTVIKNNHRWHAVHRSTVDMYPQGRAADSDSMPLVALGPSPDFDRIMQACGGYGERVEDPGELVAALERGLEAVAGGKPALLNVITAPGER